MADGSQVPVIDGWVNLPQYTLEEVTSNPTLVKLYEFFGRGPEMLSARPMSELLDEMTAAGIDRALLSGSLLGRASGNIFGPICGDATESLQQCAESGGRLKTSLFVDSLSNIGRTLGMIRDFAPHPDVVMVRVTPSALQVPIDDKRLYPLYATCEELGLPLSVNIGIYGPQQPSKYQHPLLIEDVLVDFPDLSLIGAHMGHPWEKLVIRFLMKYQNFTLMTSAYSPKYIAPEIVTFMNSKRGINKVMFASDWPVLALERSILEAQKMPLSPEAIDAYLGGNLARVVGWN